jgi:hypothetical protein
LPTATTSRPATWSGATATSSCARSISNLPKAVYRLSEKSHPIARGWLFCLSGLRLLNFNRIPDESASKLPLSRNSMTMNRTGVASDRRNIVILNLIQNLPGLPRSTPHTHGIKNLLRLHAHKSRWHTLYRRDRRPVQEGLTAPQWHRFKVPFQIKIEQVGLV